MVQHGATYVEAKPKPKASTAAGAKGRSRLDRT